MRRGFRPLHILQKEWTYKIGSSFIIIYSPSEENKYTVPRNEIQSDYYESITPEKIKNYIILKIIGK